MDMRFMDRLLYARDCCIVAMQRYSSIAALSSEGIVAVETHTGSTNAEVAEVSYHSSSRMMGNPLDLSSSSWTIARFTTQPVLDLFTEAGIVVIFLPPYSPDFIEKTFSYIKYYLIIKQHHELLPDPTPVIKAAFDSVTPQVSRGWITDCGYKN